MLRISALVFTACLLSTPAAFSQESSAGDFRDLLSAWEGHWRGEVPNPDGGTIVVHADCKVTTDGKSMVCHTYGGDLSGIWFITYDSHRKRIISQWSQSDGEVSRSEISKDGANWIAKGDGATGDGEELVFQHKITLSDDGNTHVWNRSQTVGSKTETSREEWKRLYPSRD